MSKGFMELLPWIVPVTLSPQVSAVLASVRYESNNGYNYLWRVLELTVPGFDPTVPITIPSWADADDIFHFAQEYLLYFRLQAKLNFHYDDRTRSGIFLRAVQFSEFAVRLPPCNLTSAPVETSSKTGTSPLTSASTASP